MQGGMRRARHTHSLHSRDRVQSAPSSPHFTEQGTEAQWWGEDLDPGLTDSTACLHTVLSILFQARSRRGKRGSTINRKDKAWAP